jgi:hypothetical protein
MDYMRLHRMRMLLLAGVVACAGSGRLEDVHPTGAEAPASPTPATVAPQPAPKPVAAVKSCVDGKPFDETVMKEQLAFLASKQLDGRAPGTAGDRAARALIVERFRCLGLVGAGKDGAFELPFEHQGKATANIVGYVEGNDPDVGDQIIYVGAHHDHMGKGMLGANDNASGVVGLLAVAHAVMARPARPKRTIVFATFGAEEEGMVGSYHLAKHPPKALPNEKVVQFINLDMIGSHSSRGVVAAMGALPRLSSRAFLQKLVKNWPKLNVSIGGRARGSDYEPLCKLGVPYVFFWTPDARCYHQKCDTADRIDYARMVDIASLAGALVEQMADTEKDLAAVRTKLGCGV